MSTKQIESKVLDEVLKAVKFLSPSMAAMLRTEISALHQRIAELESELTALLHNQKRWNWEESDGQLHICRGEHERSASCRWESFVPISRVDELDAKCAIQQKSCDLYVERECELTNRIEQLEAFKAKVLGSEKVWLVLTTRPTDGTEYVTAYSVRDGDLRPGIDERVVEYYRVPVDTVEPRKLRSDSDFVSGCCGSGIGMIEDPFCQECHERCEAVEKDEPAP